LGPLRHPRVHQFLRTTMLLALFILPFLTATTVLSYGLSFSLKYDLGYSGVPFAGGAIVVASNFTNVGQLTHPSNRGFSCVRFLVEWNPSSYLWLSIQPDSWREQGGRHFSSHSNERVNWQSQCHKYRLLAVQRQLWMAHRCSRCHKHQCQGLPDSRVSLLQLRDNLAHWAWRGRGGRCLSSVSGG